MSGWIKTHRSLVKWEWYDDFPCFRLFMHLLLTVNYKSSRFRGHEISIGSKVCGLNALSKQTGLSVMQIRTAIKKLESTGEITIKKTNKFSIISIVSWELYQEDNTQVTNEQQTDNTQVTPSKEGKKVKKVRNSIIAKKPDLVSESVWEDFLKLRKEKRAPVTETVLSRIQKEADKAGWNLEDVLAEICARGWQGFKAEWVQNDEKGNGHGAGSGSDAHAKMFAGFMRGNPPNS